MELKENAGVQAKVRQVLQPAEQRLLVAFEPISAAIAGRLRKLKDDRSRQKLLQEVVDDERFKPLDLGLVDGGKTTIARGSKLKINSENTLSLARNLNSRNIDVVFLPESNDVPSADAIIRYRKRLYVAEFKCSATTKESTLYASLRDGFSKSSLVVLKLSNMDLGEFAKTIAQLARKREISGDMLLVNAMGVERFVSKEKLRDGSFRKALKGFL